MSSSADEEIRLLERIADHDREAALGLVETLVAAGFADAGRIVRLLPRDALLDGDEHVPGPFVRGYTGWYPGDDAMGRNHRDAGSWSEYHAAACDQDPDLNLVVDFYFDLWHDSRDCRACDASGQNPPTKAIHDSFATARGLSSLSQDDVDHLVTQGRIAGLVRDGRRPTVDEVRTAAASDPLLVSTTERFIAAEHRARTTGVHGPCEECSGRGWFKTSDDKIGLNLWMTEPRKGRSFGIRVKVVEPHELAEVRSYLARSWAKHVEHFAWVAGADPSWRAS